MSNLREAAQQALEALEGMATWVEQRPNLHPWDTWQRVEPAMKSLRAALAEPEQDGFDQLIAEMEADPEGAQAIEDGRRWVKEQFYAGAEPEQEPVAWMHNNIRDNIISHPPADLKRHPERWTALYSEPKPCPTCVALSRAVMMDQTAHDAPPQRKPLTGEEIEQAYRKIWRDLPSEFDHTSSGWIEQGIRYAERAHGIGGNDE